MIHLDAGLINDYNSLQWRDANKFLRLCREKLGWGDLARETIMDIGCGPGNNSTKMLLKQYPDLGRIIATDGSEDMIRLAQRNNPHPKVEYFVADIQDESANRKWFGIPSKVISIHCFHWAKEQTQAFQNVFNLLQPGGEAAVLFVLNEPNFDACLDLKEDPKWNDLTKGYSCGVPESHIKKFDASHYKDIASSIGFEVIVCEEDRITFQFESDEVFKGFLSSICPLLKHIPAKRRGQFEDDLLNGTLERCGKSPDGRPNFYSTYINVLVRKPSGVAKSTMIHLDSGLINDYNSLQWRDANKFLGLCREEFGWGDLAGETIMDVGCGPGNNSTKLLLAQYPKLGKIIATDGSQDMIRLAQSINLHPKVEYFVADIQDESVHRKWFGIPSKVIAIHCFHWVKEQTQAFRNLFNLLQPGGEAALIFVLNAPNFDVCQALKENPKWKDLTKGYSCGVPESHIKKFDESHYSGIASDVGFEVIVCKEDRITFPFASDEVYKGFLSSVCPLVKHIPENLRGEFEEDLFKGTLEHCDRSPDGIPNFYCTYIHVLLRKPS